MAIVSSTFITEKPQKDGRRFVREYHTDDAGEVYDWPYYLAAAGTDYDAVMLARVPQIEAQISKAITFAKIQVDEDAAEAKEKMYLEGLSDADAKRLIGYTDDELKAIRERVR